MKYLRLALPIFIAMWLISVAGAQSVEDEARALIRDLITDPPVVIVEDDGQAGTPAGPPGPHANYHVAPKLDPSSPEYKAKAEIIREKRRREIQAKLVALGPAAAPTIGAALGNKTLPYRQYLAEALARIGDKRAVPYLIDYLDEGLSKLRAAESLAKVGETEQAETQRKEGVLILTAAVDSLRALTGQPFGNEPAYWRAWWEQNKYMYQ